MRVVSSPAITLRRDSQGQEVRLLQERLHIPITGVFDAETEHAIREFQAHHNLNVTGEADEATNAKLFEASEDAETLMQFREDE